MSDHSVTPIDDPVVIDLRELRPPHTVLDANVVVLPTALTQPPGAIAPEALRRALDGLEDMVVVTDDAGAVRHANAAARRFLRLAPHHPLPSLGALVDTVPSSMLAQVLDGPGPWQGELWVIRPDGALSQLALRVVATGADDERALHPSTGAGPDGVGGTVTIIAREQLGSDRPAAGHDPLTGLPDRARFLVQLAGRLAVRTGHRSALCQLDLDQFRLIAASSGQDVTDRLLVTAAHRLVRILGSDTLVGRIGSDEFAVFVPRVDDVDALAERICSVLDRPVSVGADELQLSMCAGIRVIEPDQPTRPGVELLGDADAACHQAKAHGRGQVEVFEPQLRAAAHQRLHAERDLRRALVDDELVVHYQPTIDLDSGRITGAEALIRWQPPGEGLRGPGTFMPLAEETGLIVPIGQWVVEQACAQVTAWKRQLPGLNLKVSVNLSVHQLVRPSLVDEIRTALDATGLDPRHLGLEVTESVVSSDVDALVTTLSGLRALGTTIAIDDFGTGYSSLQYLHRLPVDIVKVDRTFVGDLEHRNAVVVAVLQLARALGLRSVAEGVETETQLELLRTLGCDEAQGFHIAKPVEPRQFVELVASSPVW
ncbi:MAG: EAL domain-containing protein [Acidimicrobiales bacterium]|nr:EAL domain-containing protein [Acidimicrobiales bacterium]